MWTPMGAQIFNCLYAMVARFLPNIYADDLATVRRAMDLFHLLLMCAPLRPTYGGLGRTRSFLPSAIGPHSRAHWAPFKLGPNGSRTFSSAVAHSARISGLSRPVHAATAKVPRPRALRVPGHAQVEPAAVRSEVGAHAIRVQVRGRAAVHAVGPSAAGDGSVPDLLRLARTSLDHPHRYPHPRECACVPQSYRCIEGRLPTSQSMVRVCGGCTSASSSCRCGGAVDRLRASPSHAILRAAHLHADGPRALCCGRRTPSAHSSLLLCGASMVCTALHCTLRRAAAIEA